MKGTCEKSPMAAGAVAASAASLSLQRAVRIVCDTHPRELPRERSPEAVCCCCPRRARCARFENLANEEEAWDGTGKLTRERGKL
jgi:O-acetyl-ADP-ribose deacetylase (regulator of RNase III)